MRYVAAYLLAALGGNETPESKDIKKILESVGIEADDACMTKVQSRLLFTVSTATVELLAGHDFGDIHIIWTLSQQVISELKGKNVNEVIASGESATLWCFNFDEFGRSESL